MGIRTLRDSEPLDSYGEELLFTEAMLKSDQDAKEFVGPISELLARINVVRADPTGVWREEIAAQAAVSSVDEQLEDWIHAFDRVLKAVVNGDVQSPLYRRYFSSAPWTFTRLGLENQISWVRGWIDSLAYEMEPTLRPRAVTLAKIIASGDAALAQRSKAVRSRVDRRVRAITSLVGDINAARAALYANLAKKAQAARLPSDWPNRFFRTLSYDREEVTPTPTTPALSPKPATPSAT
jgi:hypothetical protein